MNRREVIIRLMDLVRQLPPGGVYQTEFLEQTFARVPTMDLVTLAIDQGVIEPPPVIEAPR